MPTLTERLREIWVGLQAALRRTAGGGRGPRTYADLRSMALGIDPSAIRRPDGERWAGAAVAAMELGLAGSRATVTIVAIADGTVSMYTSPGSGVIGAGEHAAVRGAGDRFREVVADSQGLLTRTQTFPLPTEGEVRFHARVGDDRLTGSASEALLRTGRHMLAPLYAAGQDLITEIRLASEPEEVIARG
jgi:hypothetical protein